jgi:hypothetical protein
MSNFPCPSCPLLVRCIADRPNIENKPGYDAPDYNDLFKYRMYVDILAKECEVLKNYIYENGILSQIERKELAKAFYIKGYEYDPTM